MALSLINDWEEIVKVLAPKYVGLHTPTLADDVSQKRGADGERAVSKRLKAKGYKVSSYHSKTQGDLWAISSHTSHGFKVTSIVLVQVKTSAINRYSLPLLEENTLIKTVKGVRDELKESDGTKGLPAKRSVSRIVVSGWLSTVKEVNKRYFLDTTKCITVAGCGASDDTRAIVELCKGSIQTIVTGILS